MLEMLQCRLRQWAGGLRPSYKIIEINKKGILISLDCTKFKQKRINLEKES